MRPTSAIGEDAGQAGFTLVEILVVLVILGLLSSAVLIAAPDGRPRLADEAERLAARLTRAKEEAVLTNRTVEVRITPEGYRFESNRAGVRAPLTGRAFAAMAWSPDTIAALAAADGRTRIAFDSTGFATPAEIRLFRANGSIRVAIDAGGNVKLDASGR